MFTNLFGLLLISISGFRFWSIALLSSSVSVSTGCKVHTSEVGKWELEMDTMEGGREKERYREGEGRRSPLESIVEHFCKVFKFAFSAFLLQACGLHIRVQSTGSCCSFIISQLWFLQGNRIIWTAVYLQDSFWGILCLVFIMLYECTECVLLRNSTMCSPFLFALHWICEMLVQMKVSPVLLHLWRFQYLLIDEVG